MNLDYTVLFMPLQPLYNIFIISSNFLQDKFIETQAILISVLKAKSYFYKIILGERTLK